jgi:hypothetical protein
MAPARVDRLGQEHQKTMSLEMSVDVAAMLINNGIGMQKTERTRYSCCPESFQR